MGSGQCKLNLIVTSIEQRNKINGFAEKQMFQKAVCFQDFPVPK